MKRWLVIALGTFCALPHVCADERPLVEQWQDVISYGIDSEVEELLPRIVQQGETRLDEALSERLASTRSSDLQVDLLEYFTNNERDVAVDHARALVLAYDEPVADVLQAAILYLNATVETLDEDLVTRYEEIARGTAYLPASAAVRGLGDRGGEAAASRLMDLYSRVSTTDLKGAIIRALGEAGDAGAVGMLTSIAEDTTEESSLRQYAAYSLGQIGAPESLATLTQLMSDNSALVRAYAISALGAYDDPEAVTLLSESLRDSYWRVRVAALEGIARRAERASEDGTELSGSEPAGVDVAAVVYKARRDPERPVRLAAIETLGALGTETAVNALIDLYEDRLTAVDIRTAAGQELLRGHLAQAREAVERVLAEEWEEEGSRVLDFTAKTLAEIEEPGLEDLYRRLFSHPNYIIRIYAIRGIAANGLRQHADRLREIAGEDTGALANAARAALERMGEPLPAEPEPDAP